MKAADGRGSGGVLVGVLFGLAAGLLVAGIRFWHLGDLDPLRKLFESFLWLLLVFLGVFLLNTMGSALSRLATGAGSANRPLDSSYAAGDEAVRPEDLAHIESELPEVQNPEIEGLKGTPPQELAQVLRGLSGEDGK